MHQNHRSFCVSREHLPTWYVPFSLSPLSFCLGPGSLPLLDQQIPSFPCLATSRRKNQDFVEHRSLTLPSLSSVPSLPPTPQHTQSPTAVVCREQRTITHPPAPCDEHSLARVRAATHERQQHLGFGQKKGQQLTWHRQQVETYPLYAASALAANAFVRCAFAGKFVSQTTAATTTAAALPFPVT